MALAPINDPTSGFFELRENSKAFEYVDGAERHNLWAVEQGATHTVFYRDKQTRAAKVLKTVVHILVDEDENGAVWARMLIKNHRRYY